LCQRLDHRRTRRWHNRRGRSVVQIEAVLHSLFPFTLSSC
jgi:hypothetical protein